MALMLGTFAWLFPVSLIVTIVFGIVVFVLAICWWVIFKETIRCFNTEDKKHD